MFHHISFVIRRSSFVISFNFPSLHSPSLRKSARAEYVRRGRFLLIFRHTPSYCLCPKVYHLFLFLSPRNPVFNIFSLVVLYYESIIYTPFLYQSSIIRSSFLYPFYILTPPILHLFSIKTLPLPLPKPSVFFRIL